MNHARFLFVLVLVLTVSAHAQTVTGSMSGTVVDPSGQVIPGADVTLLNEKTGEERKGTTSEVGDFAFAALVPGAYTIRVEMPGFGPPARRSSARQLAPSTRAPAVSPSRAADRRSGSTKRCVSPIWTRTLRRPEQPTLSASAAAGGKTRSCP